MFIDVIVIIDIIVIIATGVFLDDLFDSPKGGLLQVYDRGYDNSRRAESAARSSENAVVRRVGEARRCTAERVKGHRGYRCVRCCRGHSLMVHDDSGSFL